MTRTARRWAELVTRARWVRVQRLKDNVESSTVLVNARKREGDFRIAVKVLL